MRTTGEQEFIAKMSKDRISLSRTYRIIIFIVLLFCSSAVNTSGGIIASASTTIKTQLEMDNKQFGLFGTIFGMGRVTGSLLFMLLVNKINRKYLFGFIIMIKSFLLMSFNLTNIPFVLVGLRGIMGICHMFPVIYVPVWIDQFGIQKYKMIFMTILQVFIPAGKVAGYLLNLIYGEERWKLGFLTEGIFFFSASLFVLSTPDKFFSSKLTVVKDLDDTEHVEPKEQRVVSIFQTRQSTKDEKKKMTYCMEFKYIMRNPLFINGALGRSILLGVNTAFHYWISDYMKNAIHIENPHVIFWSYTLMNIGGPVGGVFAGSFIQYFFGGYENKHSASVLLATHFISCIFGMLIPFMEGLYSFCAMVLLYLIFNSSSLPMIQGIIITSVSTELKGTAFSIANLFTMMLTSGPAPVFYGFINDTFHGHKNAGMLAIMLCCCLGLLFILGMVFYRYKMYNELENSSNKVLLFDRSSKSIKNIVSGTITETTPDMTSMGGEMDSIEEDSSSSVEMRIN